MKLICTMPVRNEDWILGLSARAVLLWADALVILDHCSTDRSSEIAEKIAEEYPGRVMVLREDEPVWEEMRHRQRLLREARSLGATHVAIVDADEVLSGNLIGSIRERVEALADGRVLALPWLCLRGSTRTVHAEGTWGTSNISFAFRDLPEYHWAARDGYDFHHREPMGRSVAMKTLPDRGSGLMHLQFASDRRLRAKQALYKMIEVTRWPGRKPVAEIDRMYNLAVYDSHSPAPVVGRLSEAPRSWWEPYESLLGFLDLNAEPWQEREMAKLLAERGNQAFAGLDLFGVPDRLENSLGNSQKLTKEAPPEASRTSTGQKPDEAGAQALSEAVT